MCRDEIFEWSWLMENLPSDEDCEAFNLWAFGQERVYFHPDIPNIHRMHVWNSLHGDLLTLEPEGAVRLDLEKMWDLWEKHGKEEVKC